MYIININIHLISLYIDIKYSIIYYYIHKYKERALQLHGYIVGDVQLQCITILYYIYSIIGVQGLLLN